MLPLFARQGGTLAPALHLHSDHDVVGRRGQFLGAACRRGDLAPVLRPRVVVRYHLLEGAGHAVCAAHAARPVAVGVEGWIVVVVVVVVGRCGSVVVVVDESTIGGRGELGHVAGEGAANRVAHARDITVVATLLLLVVDRQQFLTLGLLHPVGRRTVLLVPVLLAQRLTLVLHPPVLKPHFHLESEKLLFYCCYLLYKL